MRKLSGTHWTPVAVAKKAVDFLVAGPHTKVLDLGSGAGKFCIVAAMNSPALITGVEQRENLVVLSRKLAFLHKLENVKFMCKDMKEVDFNKFNAFYFFNSFGENIDLTDRLGKQDSINDDLYKENGEFLQGALDEVSIGTRVVTYCGEGGIIPESYTLVKSTNKGKLLFWEKRY